MRKLLMLWLFLTLSYTGFAQVGPAIAGDVVIRDLISSMNDSLEQRENQLENSGHKLVNSTGDQIHFIIAELNEVFRSDLDKTFRELDKQKQDIFNKINQTIYSVDLTVSRIGDLEGLVSMDIAQFANSIGIKSDGFLLRSISGLGQVYRPSGNYSLIIVGSGLVPENKVTVSVAGTDISDSVTVGKSPYRYEYVVPSAILNELFDKDGLALKTAQLHIVIRKHELPSIINWFPKDWTLLDVFTPIRLLPDRAVKCRVVQTIGLPGWNNTLETITKSFSTGPTRRIRHRWGRDEFPPEYNNFSVDLPPDSQMDKTTSLFSVVPYQGNWDEISAPRFENDGPYGPTRVTYTYKNWFSDGTRTVTVGIGFHKLVQGINIQNIETKIFDSLDSSKSPTEIMRFDHEYSVILDQNMTTYLVEFRVFDGWTVQYRKGGKIEKGFSIIEDPSTRTLFLKIDNPY